LISDFFVFQVILLLLPANLWGTRWGVMGLVFDARMETQGCKGLKSCCWHQAAPCLASDVFTPHVGCVAPAAAQGSVAAACKRFLHVLW
jgi:hypothetical protein